MGKTPPGPGCLHCDGIVNGMQTVREGFVRRVANYARSRSTSSNSVKVSKSMVSSHSTHLPSYIS